MGINFAFCDNSIDLFHLCSWQRMIIIIYIYNANTFKGAVYVCNRNICFTVITEENMKIDSKKIGLAPCM